MTINFNLIIYAGTEIDYVEESDGVLYAYEIKYAKAGRSGPPKSWTEQYDGPYKVINRQNYQDFILPDAPSY